MTTDSNRWLEQLSILEQENALLKSRLETCEASCALLQAEVMCYRQPGRQAGARQSRDRLLEMTAIAANTLLTTENFDDAINAVLKMMGEGLETDRMSVIEFFAPPSPRLPHWQVLYEWTSPGTPQQLSNPDWIEGSFDGIEDIYDQCCRGQPVSRLIDTMAEPFRSLQAQIGVKGLYAIPISVNGHLWGVVGFDDCRVAKQRSMAELSTLKIAADCIGSAIDRQRTQRILLQTEQQRVVELAQANEILQTRDRLLETTAIAANTLLTAGDFDDAINAVLGMIGEGLDTDRVAVIELSQHLADSLPYWRVLYEWTSPGTRSQMAYPELMQGSFDGTESLLHQLNQGQIVSCYLEDLAEPFRSIQAQLDVQALYAIPIFVKGLLWGIIGFDDCRTAKQRYAVEFSVLKIAADCIGSAIERQRTQQALLQTEQQRVAELAQANEVLQARDRLLETTAIAVKTLLTGTDFNDALNTVLRIIGKALDTHRVNVIEFFEHSSATLPYWRMLYEWHGLDLPSQMADPSLSTGTHEGIEDIYHRLSQGQVVSVLVDELPESFRSGQAKLGSNRLYAIPIFVKDQVWGVIGFDGMTTPRNTAELSTLKIAADCIGSAIDRQRTQQALLQTEQQRLADLAQVNEVLQARDRLLEATAIAANTLLSTANFDNAVNTALQLIGETLDTDRVKVLECMDNSLPHPSYFAISHEWVREGIIPQISHPSSSRISGDGAEDFLHQLFQSDGFGGVLNEWPEVFWEAFEAVEAKAIYCVPIRLEGQIWGFLIFDDCREVKQRDVSELSVLKIAANCIGSGIQQQRTQQALIKAEQAKQSAILEERNRMAGELHDTLAQSFTGISLQVEAAKPLLGQTSSAVSRILDHLKDLAEAGLAAARQSVWALYPAAADYSDLAQLLYESLEAMSRNTATQIEVNVHGTPYPLPTFISMNLLRIGQEALTNALKHAQAQAITIDLTYEGNSQTGHDILLNICDDGCGFTPPTAPDAINGGFGLVSMSERCNRIGAQLSITSALGKGTRVSVEAFLP
ncbi:MAG: GAF domain-containing protein [Synechococcales cyanobacterium K44_A2020_017]|nr:GAF domain-containing protein [Synechococcales cyanobacterium K32_A2020_035]MBF2095116.1 GAF domain-containing protein [Synechococcales cyanobacterium K44_A2020_017]